MSHPLHHAISSAKKHGGTYEDYLAIHQWFDDTKMHYPDMRHRALRHHAEGIFWCESHFGVFITLANGKKVPTRVIGEQHVKEDLGFIPTIKDYLDSMNPKECYWVYKGGKSRDVQRVVEEYEYASIEKYQKQLNELNNEI